MPLVQADASQLEWRCAVELSQDEVALKEILNGDDTHSLNQQAFQLPSRLIAKIYLFRTIFRGSGWSFANDPDFMHVSSSAKYWDSVNEKFYSKYHGLDAQHKQWCLQVLEHKPIVGPLGREWLIPIKSGGEFKIPWTLLSNYPVQGTGADIMCIARLSAFRRIRDRNIPCLFVTTVHDSIVIDTPSEYIQEIVDIFHQVFDDLQKNIKLLFKYEWQVPMACECKVGPNMRDMVKIQRTA